jgi:signal transduction histidine kinase
MTVSRFLPIIIPGILIQLIVQAYYIRHALRNNDLTKARRRTFALAIAVLNLPAAVVYLFSNRSKEEKMTNDFEGVDVDPNIRQGIFVMLVIAFEIFSLRIIADNVDNPYRGILVGLLAYCFVIMIINNLFIDQSSGILYHLVPMTLIIMAIPIEYLDNSYFAQFIALLVTASIINRLPFKHARPYTIGAFCAFWIGGAAKALRFNGLGGMDEIISYMYINALIFILVIGAFYTLKRQLLTNNQLNAALVRVKEQEDQIRIMGAIAERNRITAEIHDTVGHTLTSAVIAIENAEKLFAGQPEEDLEKLSLAKDQVKKGLDEIRLSVRAIRDGNSGHFLTALKELLEEMRQNTGMEIVEIIEIKGKVPPVQQAVLLSSIKECCTNSLKHGKATRADILLQDFKKSMCMTFTDNGMGSHDFHHGFGLRAMEERVLGIGGTMRTESVYGEGFSVEITIPLVGVAGGEESG